MDKKKPTIQEVAILADVSIATVSHVINKTRYVRPELIQRVEEAMVETGYVNKTNEKKLLLGNSTVIVLMVPNLSQSIFCKLATDLDQHCSVQGYSLCLYQTKGDLKIEQFILHRLMVDKKIGGIFLVPASDNPKNYTKLIRSQIPFVCIGKKIRNDDICTVLWDNYKAAYQATQHLIKSRHETLMLLQYPNSDITAGFKQALLDNHLLYRHTSVLQLSSEKSIQQEIHSAIEKINPTGIISTSDNLTLCLLKELQEMGNEYPQDISVIGFGDTPWSELVLSPLTIIQQDSKALSELAFSMLSQLMKDIPVLERIRRVEGELILRKSTRIIDRGPFGEEAVSSDEIVLSQEEKEKLLKGHYRVAISFHFGGNAWARLHERGIRKTLEIYGISVVSVMDAQFDPALQVAQLKAIALQKPDALIAIPTDDKITAQMFNELSKTTKLIFISNVPEGLSKNSYISCVSVNERENGSNTGMMMGDYFKHKNHPKVGFIIHGAPFYGTHLRDSVAEQVVRENYPNIDIVSVEAFGTISHAYDICKEMVLSHPDLEGLYISWDQPALFAIEALEELGRTDISIFTFDLDYKIASYLAKRQMVRGLSTQRPYDQGEATALIVAKSLVSNDIPKYIGVPPYSVKPKNMVKAWKEILHESIPLTLEQELKKLI